MNKKHTKKLVTKGWRIGTVKEFLNLSDEELRLIETKRALIKLVKEIRLSNNITQDKLAKMINSSQSRIAKIESSSPDVSMDLIFKALFAMGVSQAKLAKVIATVK